jgi:hypothetical protein
MHAVAKRPRRVPASATMRVLARGSRRTCSSPEAGRGYPRRLRRSRFGVRARIRPDARAQGPVRRLPALDEIRASPAEQSALAPLLHLSPSSRDADPPSTGSSHSPRLSSVALPCLRGRVGRRRAPLRSVRGSSGHEDAGLQPRLAEARGRQRRGRLPIGANERAVRSAAQPDRSALALDTASHAPPPWRPTLRLLAPLPEVRLGVRTTHVDVLGR